MRKREECSLFSLSFLLPHLLVLERTKGTKCLLSTLPRSLNFHTDSSTHVFLIPILQIRQIRLRGYKSFPRSHSLKQALYSFKSYALLLPSCQTLQGTEATHKLRMVSTRVLSPLSLDLKGTKKKKKSDPQRRALIILST